MSTMPVKRKRNGVGTCALDENCSNEFRYLEFYAGVGGWRMAMNDAFHGSMTNKNAIGTSLCVGALDHSDLCLRVYHHNFPTDKKVKACRIEQIKPEHFTADWLADAWFMSPPCQPHTRQHDKQAEDLNDARSSSFLHICKLLEELATEALPSMICLENVVGFADSNSCRVWRKALSKRGYAVAHFHWNPTQVKLPNDRPRYFGIAVLQEKKMQVMDPSLEGILSVEENVEQAPVIQTSLEVLGVRDESAVQSNHNDLPRIRNFLDSSQGTTHVFVPDSLLKRNASWCFDIVTPDSQRSACFTSGYGKFVKGTGSVLYTGDKEAAIDLSLKRPEDRTFDAGWAQSMESNNLRYFSGLEISRLMGFDPYFQFPEDCSPKQQWKLVGNSLNVRLASRLITLGLCLCGRFSLENSGIITGRTR